MLRTADSFTKQGKGLGETENVFPKYCKGIGGHQAGVHHLGSCRKEFIALAGVAQWLEHQPVN